MSVNLMYVFALLFGGFAINRLVLHWLPQTELNTKYRPLTDPWLYMWLVLSAGMFSVFYFIPHNFDFIAEFGAINLVAWFSLALIIYIVFLFEIDWLTFLAIVVASITVTFLIPDNELIFHGYLPFWADRLAVVVILALMTFGTSLLNGMAGLYPMQMIIAGLGLTVMGFLGGLPIMIGFLGAFMAGVWLGYLHLNRYPADLFINDGAALSGGFILACILLQGAIEFAGSSMIVLCMYIVAELTFALVNRYFFHQDRANFQENTSYWNTFNEGVEIRAMTFGIFRIMVINLILSLFQLYIPNSYSMLIFAFIVDLWLMNIMYRASGGTITFKQANKEFLENIKKSFADITKPSQGDDNKS